MPPPTGPRLAVTLDAPPPSLQGSQALEGHLLRLLPGPDRPDYCVVLLDDDVRLQVRPDELRSQGVDPAVLHPDMTRPGADGALDVQVWAIVICSAWDGVSFAPGMRDVPTQVALVLDNRVLRAPTLDMAAVWPIGMATTTELSPGTV